MTEARVVDPYLLEIPADASFLTTARLFAGAITRQFASEAVVGDVKLAVTEAASALLSADDAEAPLQIESSGDERSLRFTVTRQVPVSVPPPAVDVTAPLHGLDLVRAIFPTLAVEAGTSSTAITFEAALQ